MKKIKNLLFYGGIEKDIYEIVSYRASDENRRAINVFSFVGAFALIFSGIAASRKNVDVPIFGYFIFAGAFMVMFMLNKTLYSKYHRISDVCAVLYSIALLSVGVIIAYSQANERTTMLLPLFSLVALVFCYRPIYLILIIVGVETTYLVLMKGVENESLYFVNAVNTLIFSSIGIVSGLYTLNIKYIKYKSEYENQILIEKDGLTGLYNRFSYNNACERIKGLKKPVAICSFDINGLKQLNDSKGHLAGDELIRGAADCISAVFGKYGDIYRTGGDEFCAIIYSDFDKDAVIKEFDETMKAWKGKLSDVMSIALGMANLDYEYEDRLIDIIHEADSNMYSNKKAYYEANRKKR